MPTYIYRCPHCEFEKEVFHFIKECDAPSQETLKEISCQCGESDVKFVRKPTTFAISEFSNASLAKKRDILHKRATADYEQNIKPEKIERLRTVANKNGTNL